MRLLIVNADDWGMAPEVNQAILQAHQHGIVSSTTVMANCPAAAELPPPTLGLGLHCNVTHGRPLTAAPSLTNEKGEFWSALELLQRHDRVDHGELLRELQAQRERFEALYGRPPDHLDVHQYSLCFFAAGLDAVRRTADGLPTRNYLNFLDPFPFRALVQRIEEAHDLTLPPLQHVELAGPHPPSTDHWEHRLTRRSTPEEVLKWLEQYSGSVELMCHPGAGEVKLLTSETLQHLPRGTFADL